ncbi:arabinose transporter [Rhizobium sp. CB3090]|uniref:arabinose transporter n=1 Tax=Rhizobium sp. CB3090 TaxID=3039156 RepID=UPI0024B21403|nr:arabinose transporter [Rhizobium sp. CB3090]WFU10307.1 arabinose transporter [Rhizobium sp. CB3090]
MTEVPMQESETSRLAIPLLPIMTAVFVAFLVIGLALPVLPMHVHDGLGLGGFAVGVVAGAQFAASLVSRVWAGHFADNRGGKLAVVCGLVGASVAGLLYLVSLEFESTPVASVSILVAGRAVLGGAESFIITGAVGWGLVLGSPANTGKVIAWIGTAMYAAFAVGAPIGGSLYDAFGFVSVALATILVPALTLSVVVPMKAVASPHREPAAIRAVLGAIWVPGVGLAMASLGFGAMMTFASLLFAERGWTPVWIGVTVFAVSFICARVFCGHLADRLGGATVALACLVLEALGLAVIWYSPWELLAVLGAALTGFGYSLVYPGLGVEAIRRAPAKSNGLAMGTYTAFLDLALGFASPLLGLLAGGAGTRSVFLASAIVVACACPVAAWLKKRTVATTRQ